MQKAAVLLILLFFGCLDNAHAQNEHFISINPDFGLKGQTISTTVTASGFFFTSGTSPASWGYFYMVQNGQYIAPFSATVIDDDHLNVTWNIPSNAASGNFHVAWDLSMITGNFYTIPNGFNIQCIPPPAQITNSLPVIFCAGGNVVLTANAGTGLSYQWFSSTSPYFIGSALLNGETNSTISVNNPVFYNVRVSDAQGCPNFSDFVSVNSITPPIATISPGVTQVVCPGTTVTLTANSGNNYTYKWFKNGVLINGAVSGTYSTSDTGSYTVRVTNGSGCSTLSSPRIISAAPLPPSYVTANGPLTFCAGNSVKLKTSAGTGYSYQWYKYGNPIAGATGQSLVVTSTGSYKVMVTNSYGCTKKSGNQNVSVLNAPAAIITPAGPTAICAGDSVKLNANNGSGYTYYWKRYGVTIAGATASSYTAKNGGSYKVVVTSSNGCSKLSAPVTVSVVCREGLNSEMADPATDLFPNPAKDQIFISGHDLTRVDIISADGKTVKSVTACSESAIDISDLPPGLYIAVICSENEVVTKKFLKE